MRLLIKQVLGTSLIASACLFSCAIGSYAVASTVVVGAPATTNNCFPFGCPAKAYGGRYQQLYDASDFSSPLTIAGLTFYSTVFPTTSVDSGTFSFSLSTTKSSLSTNPDANLGANNTLVYSGALPAVAGSEFTVNFSTPFTYDPASGNLLLDISSPDAKSTGLGAFDASFSSGFSRYYVSSINGPTVENDGLVTGFVTGTVSSVPLPASAPMFGAALIGLAGLGYAAKRKTAAAAAA